MTLALFSILGCSDSLTEQVKIRSLFGLMYPSAFFDQ